MTCFGFACYISGLINLICAIRFRNCFFQVGYIIIVGVIHASVIYDGLFVVLTVQPHSNPLFWPFTLLAINMFIFLVCCFSDPGMLSKQGHGAALLKHSMAIYPYDGLIFSSGGICSTCNLTKPARSKHCCKYCHFVIHHWNMGNGWLRWVMLNCFWTIVVSVCKAGVEWSLRSFFLVIS